MEGVESSKKGKCDSLRCGESARKESQWDIIIASMLPSTLPIT